MRWRRCDSVQDIGALIVLGPDAAERLARAIAARVAVLGDLAVEHGDLWAAVVAGDGAMLPRIADAVALYEASPGWWFPIGIDLDVPEHARPPVLNALARREGIGSAVIALPRFREDEATSADADLYPLGRAVPFRASVLSEMA